MKRRLSLVSVFLAFVVVFTQLALPKQEFMVRADEDAVASDGIENATIEAFITDPRWADGVFWNDYSRPELATDYDSVACCAYVADYVRFCYGLYKYADGTRFYSKSDIQVGDVIHDQGHFFIVIDRSGNTITKAEGNWHPVDINSYDAYVHVGGTKNISDISNSFEGWHYPVLPESGCPEISVPSAIYVIHSAWNDNFCLDIAGDSTDNNANIQLYQRTKSTRVQEFRIINWNDYNCIQSVHSGLWLDAARPIKDNSNVKLYTTNTDTEDFWYFEDAGDGYVYIRNRTGYYLDVQGDEAKNNANIQLYHFVGNKSQKWRLEDVSSYVSMPVGDYVIHSAWNDSYCLDIQGNSTENNANIQLYQRDSSNDVQTFTLSKAGNFYYIQSKYNKLWLDVKLPARDYANVKLYYTNDATENQWIFEDAGNGYVYIKNKWGYYLDVKGDVAENNANIQLYHFVGNNSQKWRLEELNPAPNLTMPKNVKIEMTSEKNASLSWSAVSGAQGYYIYSWNPSTGGGLKVGSTTDLQFALSGLLAGKTYTYSVMAYTKMNGKEYTSAQSTRVSITVSEAEPPTGEPGPNTGTPEPGPGTGTPVPEPNTPAPDKEPSFEDFVERLYTIALGRASEAEGKAYWVEQVVKNGFTGADCARFFLLEAPEFMGRGLTDDQFVETLYLTFFGRESEADGKAYWLGRLASGSTRAELVNEFIESTEWCNICATYGVKSGALYHKATIPSKNAVKFATRLYTCCLGRDPEEDGLNYWSLALTNLEATGYQAASLFFTLPEFVGLKTTNEEYLTRLYTTFMGREPEADGFAYWLGLLNGGTDRVDVMKAFAGCPEFQEICNQYGIVRGEI